MIEVDILAIAAHPDDVEITCGGTIIKMVEAGYRVGILDLTAGETGTRGDAPLRAKEAHRATQALGVVYRENLHIPDAGVENTRANKRVRSVFPGRPRQAAAGA
jgi:LmbE family N-acetylglucosaminyl deacetylase